MSVQERSYGVVRNPLWKPFKLKYKNMRNKSKIWWKFLWGIFQWIGTSTIINWFCLSYTALLGSQCRQGGLGDGYDALRHSNSAAHKGRHPPGGGRWCHLLPQAVHISATKLPGMVITTMHASLQMITSITLLAMWSKILFIKIVLSLIHSQQNLLNFTSQFVETGIKTNIKYLK